MIYNLVNSHILGLSQCLVSCAVLLDVYAFFICNPFSRNKPVMTGARDNLEIQSDVV